MTTRVLPATADLDRTIEPAPKGQCNKMSEQAKQATKETRKQGKGEANDVLTDGTSCRRTGADQTNLRTVKTMETSEQI